MNNNFVRGQGLGLGRLRGSSRMRGFGRADRFLDEARFQDLDLYDVPRLRGGMRFQDGSCRIRRFDGRGLRLRDGSCRYPDRIGRGMYYRDQRMAEIEKEIQEKKEQR